MKLSELLKNRAKLEKYDELKEWRDRINVGELFISTFKADKVLMPLSMLLDVKLPDHIKQIILDAIDAEIKKMEEE